MKVLITDDEAPARMRLRDMLGSLPGHEIVGEAADGADALRLAEQQQPDVVLLDIRMPGMDGLEAARHLAQLEHPPAVIFTTAYDQHALEAFEASAVDYLLKPIRKARLEEALAKARRPTRAQLNELEVDEQPGARTHLCVRLRGNLQLVPVDTVYYFMADQKYVSVRHQGGEVLIEDSLRALEQEFGDRFLRIHRNALVAVAYIEGLEKTSTGQVVKLRGTDERLEVSRRHAPAVRQLIKRMH
jgi:two-component system response regulator AlgR